MSLKYIVFIALIIFTYSHLSISKDMRDASDKWTCSFPVNASGDEPICNFFWCKEKGCNEDIYKFYKRPETYLEIKDFIIDLKSNSVSYK